MLNICIRNVSQAGERIKILIVDPATGQTVDAEGEEVTGNEIRFLAPKRPGARRALRAFTTGNRYDLRIESDAAPPAFAPLVLGGAFVWTPTAAAAAGIPYVSAAAAASAASGLAIGFVLSLVGAAVGLLALL
eukprot:tig00020629_g12382.t1